MSAGAFTECLKNAQFKHTLGDLMDDAGGLVELSTTCEETTYSLKGREHCVPWTS